MMPADFLHVTHMKGFEPDTAPVRVNSVFSNMKPKDPTPSKSTKSQPAESDAAIEKENSK